MGISPRATFTLWPTSFILITEALQCCGLKNSDMASAEALYSRGSHSPNHSPTVERLHQPNSR